MRQLALGISVRLLILFAAETSPCEYKQSASLVPTRNHTQARSGKLSAKQKNDRKTRRRKQTQYYDIQDSHKILRKHIDELQYSQVLSPSITLKTFILSSSVTLDARVPLHLSASYCYQGHYNTRPTTRHKGV